MPSPLGRRVSGDPSPAITLRPVTFWPVAFRPTVSLAGTPAVIRLSSVAGLMDPVATCGRSVPVAPVGR
ncbi:hypothetical protein CgIS1_07410 [Frankia sp. CgS1]|nr:hypothetical protein CgIS1_07410 [Frankia sp. CgIS1]